MASYRQHPSVAWRRIRGKDNALLVLPSTCTVLGLSPVATDIWERLEDWTDHDVLLADLQAQYDAPAAEIARDLAEFLRALISRGLVDERA
jgi:hypothetical protein